MSLSERVERLGEHLRRVFHAADSKPVPVQLNALKIALETFAREQQPGLKPRLFVVAGETRDTAGNPVHGLALRCGSFLSGRTLSGAYVTDIGISVGTAHSDVYEDRFVPEQRFDLTQVEAATAALLAVSRRELAISAPQAAAASAPVAEKV